MESLLSACGNRAPRPGVSTNPATVDARVAGKMGQRASGGTTLSAAVLLLRAAADPASTVRIELPDGTVLETAKLSPNRVKGVFIVEGGNAHPFDGIRISFDAWGKWLAANGHIGFRPGTAAWREPVAAEAAPVEARPERRKIERMDRRAAKTPLARGMKQPVDDPPDWVWLTKARLILRRRFRVDFTTWAMYLRSDIRKWQLQHRVAELRLADGYAGANDVIWGNTRIPGLTYSSEERNVIVDDWDAADVDW